VVSAKRLASTASILLHCSPAAACAAWRPHRHGAARPKFSLNPVMTIGARSWKPCVPTQGVGSEARLQAMASAGIGADRRPERVFKLYPHEVSGGMGQRAMIAMMLIAKPDLLIADEPTSALDVTVQLQVLQFWTQLVVQRGMGLIFVSHDLRLVSTFCDRILVMYAGKVVEELQAGGLAAARHPYTQGLLNCLPKLGDDRHPLPTLNRQPEWSL
jgi:peptide/nickel transport system ATP-binding protein